MPSLASTMVSEPRRPRSVTQAELVHTAADAVLDLGGDRLVQAGDVDGLVGELPGSSSCSTISAKRTVKT